MTTGEIIGIGIGIAGLGVAGYMLITRERSAPPATATGYNAGPPAGWNGSWGYSQPPNPQSTQIQQTANDVGSAINGVVGAVGSIVGLFDQLGTAFNW